MHALGNFERAHESFDTAISLEPDKCMFYHSKGLTFSEQKMVGPSIEMFEKAIDLDATHLPSYFHLALSLH
jgi:cytochrome c-type biogenesis protein CcmH/NrfG